jgi:hypothetical protein
MNHRRLHWHWKVLEWNVFLPLPIYWNFLQVTNAYNHSQLFPQVLLLSAFSTVNHSFEILSSLESSLPRVAYSSFTPISLTTLHPVPLSSRPLQSTSPIIPLDVQLIRSSPNHMITTLTSTAAPNSDFFSNLSLAASPVSNTELIFFLSYICLSCWVPWLFSGSDNFQKFRLKNPGIAFLSCSSGQLLFSPIQSTLVMLLT